MDYPRDFLAFKAEPGVLEPFGWTWVHGSDEAPWDDHSYLKPAERADPDIAANVRAMTETNALVDWVLVHEDGEYLGYWRGPQGRPSAASPVVMLDNEGQYRIQGDTLGGAVASLYDEDGAELVAWLKARGIDVDPDCWPEGDPDPGELRDERYTAILNGEDP
ncbi:MAG: hypothetical protein KC656_13950 [Myxococcales bacterium]|nr:hypothetical protein [Myxococcales bacterium]MCB9690912.1 hypothetical protein [Alphaproteobacteria bacterium]